MELTKNELEIMEVLWQEKSPLTSSAIVELSNDKTWKASSIHILINSLLKKGAIQEVGYVRAGKGYGRTFQATVKGQKYYTDYLANIGKKVNITNLFSALITSEEINKDTIEELEVLLRKKKRELK